MTRPEERARGTLHGLAIGDALGMPTQSLSRQRVKDTYGVLTGFLPAAPDHPLAAGMPAGSVTDDTEQALLLARLLIEGAGHVDPVALAHSLLEWEEEMRRRGSLDLLGPSTKRAVAAVAAGASVEEAGRYGDTNGAAMRIAPVGITAGSDLTALVDSVVEASSVTHNTSVALAGAAAVAAAVSAGIDGADVKEATRHAEDAAAMGVRRGHWVAAADIASRIRWATELVAGRPAEAAADDIYRLVGTSLATQESVPAAFAILAVYPDDPWQACLRAASLGGDCDTIAAIAGAIAGACHGVAGFPRDAIDTIRAVNALPLDDLAGRLLALRP
ncbi:ADP-ribosylglycohydrolase family protein [Actinoallomurus rhizosphaericola]|uniref:ADP-ribosylglycohydrolase family protein n=1 Tax=Actinoallomurus rhizosphaericola TaxID=2952536 RepID=UPI002090DB5C|nr:ADP-ribosylglycohydrolase family protein [Actinoallomurus rhizosphaericola]MCO5993930.1 ADP-ribosylglycohydrolase family protein [Actinoallomurus rhizosphaericola]